MGVLMDAYFGDDNWEEEEEDEERDFFDDDEDAEEKREWYKDLRRYGEKRTLEDDFDCD